MPRIHERGANSNLQQEPVENVSIAEEIQESVLKSDLHEGQVEIADAETIAMVTSLSSLSTVSQYLAPDNQNLLQGRVYIPETVMVASSPSQSTRNQFIVPIPDPICSTRVVPVGKVLQNSNPQDVLQSTPVTEVQGDNNVCDLEPMEIEMSPTVTHESQHEPFVLPSMTSMNHVQGASSVQYIEQSMDVHYVNHDSEDTCIQIDNYDYRLIRCFRLRTDTN